MSKHMLIDAQHQEETRVVILDDDVIEDFDFVTTSKQQLKGNIYLAKITRVEPSLQAAFVEYGGNKQGFLPFSEIHPDYYQIPFEDKQRLLEEELEEAARAEEEEEAELEDEQKGKRRGRRRGGRNRRRSKEGESGGSPDATDAEAESGVMAAEATSYEVASDPVEDIAANDEADADAEADESEVVETVSADEPVETQRRRGSTFKRYRIQEVIKRNQIVLVQVIKEERGNKGCSLTTYISLAGRYCVLMPNSPKGGGVSRKISNGEQRRKLKEVLSEMREKRGLSAIIRTAGIDRTKVEIKRDYEYLVKLWSQIREDTLASNAPSLIYQESDILKRSLRDMYTSDIEQVLVQGDEAYKDSKAFMKLIMPSHAPRVKHYKEPMPIFAAWGVEEQLASMYEPEVKMPSGGSIVIQQTEALISIDVNSGRSTSERNVEETAIKTNLEAAREVARQMRLRDLAGIVVVDFIDMYYGKNRRNLERAMKDALKHDRAKIQLSRISPFGLLEMSRQRLRPSIVESSSRVCHVCLGTGFVKSVETVAIQAIRTVEREAVSGEFTTLRIIAAPEVIVHLMNEKREMIQGIEADYGVSIQFEIGADMHSGEVRIMKVTEDGKEVLHRESEDDRNRRRKSRGRRGGRGRRKKEDADMSDEEDTSDDTASDEASNDNEKPVAAKTESSEGDKSKRRRSTPRRRGRKPNDEVKANETAKPADAESEEVAEPAVNAAEAPKEEVKSEEEKAEKPRKRAAPRRRTRKSESDKNEDATDLDSPQSQETVVDIHTSSGESAGGSAPAGDAPSAETSDASGSDAQRPKRKGWWNRIVQSEE